MSKTALDINALDLDYALAGETEIYIVPIVAPILRAGYSRGDAVENFKQILGSAKIVQSFDVTIDHNDDHEPFKIFEDKEYCITDLTSLRNIKENKRLDCNFGLRVYIPSEDEFKLKVINNDVLQEPGMPDLGITDLSKGLSFDKLQPLKDAIFTQIHERNNKNLAQQCSTEIKRKKVKSLHHKDDFSEISNLKDRLYNTLDALVDQVYLDDDNLTFRSIVSEQDYDDNVLPIYQKLEQLTVDNFNQAKRDKLNILQKKREDMIQSIFNQLVSDLWSKNVEADAMRNYKAEDSRYHPSFKEIEQSFQQTLETIPKKVKTETQQLEKAFEEDKQYRADKARRDMAEKIEREERPLLHNRIADYEKSLTNKAKHAYHNQIKVLDAEVKANYDLQLSKIVDDVISNHQQIITKKKADLQAIMEKDTTALLEKRSEDVDKLRHEISKLEQELIQNEKTFNERLDLAVNQKVSDYELKDSQMTDEIHWLRVELEKAKRENVDKNEAIRSKEMELQNNRGQLDRLNQQLEQSNQTSLTISARALEIKQQALSFANHNSNNTQPSEIVSPQNIDINNLLGEDADKAKRYERRKKPTFFTWLGGLLFCAVLGTGTLFGSHVANADEQHTNTDQAQTHTEQSDKNKASN